VNWALSPRVNAGEQVALDRHMNKANYTFVDGHAEPLRFEQTYHINGRKREGPRLVISWGHNMYDPTIGF